MTAYGFAGAPLASIQVSSVRGAASLEVFRTMDPQLRELRRLPFAYRYPLLQHLPVDRPGVYSITGSRRIGKSTVLKQWMADLLHAGVQPQRIGCRSQTDFKNQ